MLNSAKYAEMVDHIGLGLWFNRKSGNWNLGKEAAGFDCVPVINGKELSLKDASDIKINCPQSDSYQKQIELIAEFSEPRINVILSFELSGNKPVTTILLSIENPGTEPITVGDSRIFSMDANSKLNLGANPGELIVFEFRDTLGDNYVRKIGANQGIHESVQLCHISHPETGKTFFSGNLTFDKMFSQCAIKYNSETGKIESLEMTMQFNDFVLEPGKTVSSEKIYMEIADDGPYRVLERWAKQVNAIYQPIIPETASAGWIGWSWIDGFKTELPESVTRRNSEAIRKRLAGFDIEYLWISITNLKNGLPGNWLSPNDTFFPAGLENTVAELKNLGFKPGFWVAPFYMCEGAEAFDKNRGNLQKDGNREPIPRHGWLWAANAKDDNLPKLHCLDPSHPDTEKYIRKVFSEYRKMGIRYFMIDFLNSGRARDDVVPHQSSYVKPWEAYRKCMEAIRETTGPDTHLLTAVGSTLAHIGTVSASRIGLDYGEGRLLMPRFPSYPANYIINGSYGSSGSPNRNAINNLACWFFAHRTFFMCDSNMLSVDKPIPRNEAEISATLFGISGGPMMMGDDIDMICEERLALIKKCLPRGKSAPFPATLFSNVDSNDHSQIFVVTVEKPWGKWRVVAVFNLNDKFKTFELDAEKLQMDAEKRYRMFDFWRESYCGIFENRTRMEIPANSAAVYRFEEVKEHPWILSTDMHIRQGEAELLDVGWDEENLALKVTATRPAGETGNVYIVTPWNWKPRNFNKGLWVAKSGIDESLIIRTEIKFKSEIETRHIDFERFTQEEICWRNKNMQK